MSFTNITLFKIQISGVGLFAGVPYLCAYQFGSYISCMNAPDLVDATLLIAGYNNTMVKLAKKTFFTIKN